MLESFYNYLESVLTWFFGSSILQDSLISLVVKCIEFYYGLWLLYIFLVKPISMLLKAIDEKIYK